ncbi:uncharacterized protein LOC119646250 [Hermetia illucens]|uniref:uncharacterized protein LOC119646250 n=1 Tax=Hermetia illucens TaxID=343691 RepID=UPI0018CC17D9|nr:uncharacterized protein LOC119646250 [Hermetia illucens]
MIVTSKFQYSLYVVFLIIFFSLLHPGLGKTEIDRSLSTHLSRQKRFFVFLKSSTFSVGMSGAKRVSQPSPTSTNIVIGLGCAYDLPTKVDDWRWRLKFRNRNTKPPNTN